MSPDHHSDPSQAGVGALGDSDNEDEEEECVFCGERKGTFEFWDGLRCVTCAERDEERERER